MPIERCCVFIYKKEVLYAAHCSQTVKPLVVGTSTKAPEWHSRICLPLIFLLFLSLQPQPRVGSSVGTAGDLLHRTTAKTMEVLTTTGLNTKAVLTAVSDHRWWKDSLNYLRPLHVRIHWLCCFINSSLQMKIFFCKVLNGCTYHLVGLKSTVSMHFTDINVFIFCVIIMIN